MRIKELRGFLESELDYPVDGRSVVERVGGVEVEAPDLADSETVATVLGRLEEATYDSADELFEALVGALSDEYIGRKFYDDRGGNPAGATAGRNDEADVTI